MVTRSQRANARTLGIITAGAAAAFFTVPSVETLAQQAPPDQIAIPSTLKGVKPLLPNLSDYVVDELALRALGKALFWDTQVGSDGNACASCHFHAGADIRVKNQVNPGILAGDTTFAKRTDGSPTGPNKQLGAADFPFHKLSDPNNRNSNIVSSINDVFSSQGTFAGDFVGANRGANRVLVSSFLSYFRALHVGAIATEKCNLNYDTTNPFHVNQLIYRKVEPRHTPTTVNAVFFTRQFWDGRANRDFNGVDPFGPRTYVRQFSDVDASGKAITLGNKDAAGTGILVNNFISPVRLTQPLIQNASLASQAVGPPLSDFEMSCSGRTFADLGRKLLTARPLASQTVAFDDSVFGTIGLVNYFSPKGLMTTYKSLIERAFKPKYWLSASRFKVDPATGAVNQSLLSGYTMMEYNFSLFWGLAIQAYEASLISDDAPFDRGLAAMSPAANEGFGLFVGKGKCVGCHSGPLFTNAAAISPTFVEGMRMGDGNPALYDEGFYNIGVRETSDDLGVGRQDPYGFDLSFARQYKWRLLGRNNRAPDRLNVDACKFDVALFPNCASPPRFSSPQSTPRDAVDGAFKAPTLRNVGLNPPYFHTGGVSNLKDVVRFYNRGGNRRGPLNADTTGLAETTPFGQTNATNLDADIGDASATSRNNSLGLTEGEMDKLVAFLLELTDKRVACHAGVFDHPALPISLGQNDVAVTGTQKAQDIVKTLPAVGRKGYSTCFPNTGDLFQMQPAFQAILR